MLNPYFWWAIVGFALMICEFVVPGLVLFFFGLGALFTAIVVFFFSPSLTLQLLIFLIASLVSLFTLRRVLKNIFMGHITAINSDVLKEGFVGTEGVVLEKIAPNAPGKVMINGTRWKAESVETIEPDQPIVVVEQKSLTVIVKSK